MRFELWRDQGPSPKAITLSRTGEICRMELKSDSHVYSVDFDPELLIDVAQGREVKLQTVREMWMLTRFEGSIKIEVIADETSIASVLVGASRYVQAISWAIQART